MGSLLLLIKGLFERLACNFNSLLNWPGGAAAEKALCAASISTRAKTKQKQSPGVQQQRQHYKRASLFIETAIVIC
jgi:hypothetical protein